MSTHRCEKLLLALIMAYERSHWPAAMRATPANFSARGVSRCESRIGDSGRRTDEEEPARVLPAAVLGREERIFEDVLEDAGAVCDVVQLPVVEEVRCRGGSIVSAHAHASREVRGDDLTGHGELARVVHGRDDELGEVKEAPAREVEASWDECVAAYQTPCGRDSTWLLRPCAVHANQVEALRARRTAPRDQHVPRTNAMAATL